MGILLPRFWLIPVFVWFVEVELWRQEEMVAVSSMIHLYYSHVFSYFTWNDDTDHNQFEKWERLKSLPSKPHPNLPVTWDNQAKFTYGFRTWLAIGRRRWGSDCAPVSVQGHSNRQTPSINKTSDMDTDGCHNKAQRNFRHWWMTWGCWDPPLHSRSTIRG